MINLIAKLERHKSAAVVPIVGACLRVRPYLLNEALIVVDIPTVRPCSRPERGNLLGDILLSGRWRA